MLPVSVAITTMTSLVAIASRLVVGSMPLVLLMAIAVITQAVLTMQEVAPVKNLNAPITQMPLVVTITHLGRTTVVGVMLTAPVRLLTPVLVVALMTAHLQPQHLHQDRLIRQHRP